MSQRESFAAEVRRVAYLRGVLREVLRTAEDPHERGYALDTIVRLVEKALQEDRP